MFRTENETCNIYISFAGTQQIISVCGRGERHFREHLLILRYFKHAEIDMYYCGKDIIFIIIQGES